MKDAELSWLDARLTRKAQILPGAAIAETASEQEIEHLSDIAPKKSPEVQINAAKEVEPMDTQESVSDSESAQTLVVMRKAPVLSVPDVLCLEAVPASLIPPHSSVFVNDPKLTDLVSLIFVSAYTHLTLIAHLHFITKSKASAFCACESWAWDLFRMDVDGLSGSRASHSSS